MSASFIAPKIKTLDEIIEEYPNGLNIILRVIYPYTTNYDGICQLEKELQEMSVYAIKQIMPGGFVYGVVPFQEELERIALIKRKLICALNPDAVIFYSEKPQLIYSDRKLSLVCDLEEYDIEDIVENMMDWESFKSLWDRRFEKIDDESFEDWLDKELCSEWSKVDIDGSYTYGDDLRSKNVDALMKLDYPRCWIQHVVQTGCGNPFGDDLPYVKVICEWIRCKGRVVFNRRSLKELCRRVILDNKQLPLDHLPDGLIKFIGAKMLEFTKQDGNTEKVVLRP